MTHRARIAVEGAPESRQVKREEVGKDSATPFLGATIDPRESGNRWVWVGIEGCGSGGLWIGAYGSGLMDREA